jgi:hypothetical protein
MNVKMIAPCGMNCEICLGSFREKNPCPGCRSMDNKPGYCRKCIIRNCLILKKKKMKFCSDKCDKYPCKRLKGLDKRYKIKYGMSMIENLENIKKSGIKKFAENEDKRWKCPKCGKTLCVHRPQCLNCGAKRKVKKYLK